jgi:hypothetical protein
VRVTLLVLLLYNLLVKFIDNVPFDLKSMFYKLRPIAIAHSQEERLGRGTTKKVADKLRLFSLGQETEEILESVLAAIDISKFIPEVLEHLHVVGS